MAAADSLITRDGPVAVPLDYPVPAAAAIVMLCVSATFADPNVVGEYTPALELITPDNRIIGPFPLGQSIAAGASARVSWFPGIGANIGGSFQSFGGARLYNDATQSIANNVNVDTVYDVVQFDNGGMANLAANNKILTAQVTGWYLLNMGAGFDSNATGNRLGIVIVNGYYSLATGQQVTADSKNAVSIAGARTPVNALGVIHLNAGDFVSAGVQQSSGAPLNIGGLSQYQARSFLAASLIGVG